MGVLFYGRGEMLWAVSVRWLGVRGEGVDMLFSFFLFLYAREGWGERWGWGRG